MDQATNFNLVIILGATTGVVFGVLFCLLLWRLVFKIVRALVKHIDVFGTTVAIRLVALGITVWLRPQAVLGPINAVTAFAKPFLEKMPPLIASLAAYHRSGEINSLVNFIPQLTGVFVLALTDFLSALGLPSLILALAMWVALGSVLSVLLQNQLAPFMAGLFAKVESLSRATRAHIALFAILAFACYLSIAAIVAVPYLRQSAESTEPEMAALAARLEASRIPTDIYNSRYPLEIPPPEGFSELRRTVRELMDPSSANQPAAGSNPSKVLPNKFAPEGHEELGIVGGVLDTLDGNRSSLVADYRSLRDKGMQQEATLKSMAMSIFAANGGRGKQERARYATELDIWYRTQVSNIDSGLSSCVQRIGALDGALNLFSGVLRPILSSKGESPGIAQMIEPLKEAFKGSVGCAFDISDNPPELRPASHWGPLGTIARWILGSESLDLALITGMLGFGLLGAAISTFVRKQALLGLQDQALVADLVGVIIRGLSAAIVVFLAALGGLAIFSNSEGGQATEPNPYALFLTCLAAAVFSEDVWLRVRSRLREQAGSTKTVD
jgi:hypothetical protein